jgi:two-component system, NarL family, sensor kinase
VISPPAASTPARVGAAVAALCVLLALAAAVVVTRAGAWGLPATSNSPVDLAIALSYPVMGALVLGAGRSGRAVGTVMLVAGAASAGGLFATALAAVAETPTLAARAAGQIGTTLWVPGFLTLVTLLPLLFPDGPLPGRVWRVLAWGSGVGIALLTVAVALFPEPVQGRIRLDEVVVSSKAASVFLLPGVVLVVAGAAGSLTALVLRLRRSSGLVRRQVVVLLGAAAVLLADVLLQPLLPAPADVLSQAVAVALPPIAVAVAVTRHRLYDLDLAVRRALTAASLVICLAGLYVAAFSLLEAVLGGRTAVAGALAAGLTGLVVLPLGSRLARGVDRLYYGDRADRYGVVSALTAALREQGDVADVPQAVCDRVVDSLRLSSAELVVDARRRANAGTPLGPPTTLPLLHRGEEVGALTVTPRAGERSLDPRDAELVAALADSAAPAVAALRLTDSLQSAREGLVLAREEERRRVRRDLHDGVGAALAGLRLQLDSARDLVDEPLAAKLLDAVSDGLAETVRDVRQVTEDLRPPALDDLGLAGSLRALADRVRTPDLAVSAEVGELPPLVAAVEVACYRIVAEALANAVRHAGARHVSVAVRAGAGIELSVRDDGQGFDVDRTPGRGLGLTSMRQRAEEIGGRFSIRSTSEGTLLTVVLPAGAA